MEDIRFESEYYPILKNTGFINVERNKNHTFEFKNGKDRFSFIYVEKGNLDCVFSNKIFGLKTGEMIFIPKNLPYKTKYLENETKLKIILFDTDDNLPFPTDKPFINKSLEIKNLFMKEKMNNCLFLISQIYKILYFLQNERLEVPKKYQNILPAIKEINALYFENKKIGFYADLCNMSESNFRKLFRECTGKTPIEYRNMIRIIELKKLLNSGEFSVNEAAYSVGFNNMSFFYDVFNKYK